MSGEQRKLTSYQYLGFNHNRDLRVYWGSGIKKLGKEGERVMSLRLSTGIMGHIDCPSGDGEGIPKGPSEVMVGVGEGGIAKLLELGGLPCVTCHSGEVLSSMSQGVAELLRTKLGGDLKHASDFGYLTSHYDASRLDWMQILPLFAEYQLGSPGRFYARRQMPSAAVTSTRKLFTDFGIAPPQVGFFDREKLAGGMDPFTEY